MALILFSIDDLNKYLFKIMMKISFDKNDFKSHCNSSMVCDRLYPDGSGINWSLEIYPDFCVAICIGLEDLAVFDVLPHSTVRTVGDLYTLNPDIMVTPALYDHCIPKLSGFRTDGNPSINFMFRGPAHWMS